MNNFNFKNELNEKLKDMVKELDLQIEKGLRYVMMNNFPNDSDKFIQLDKLLEFAKSKNVEMVYEINNSFFDINKPYIMTTRIKFIMTNDEGNIKELH